jgi:ERCC4-type nuclease
MHLMQLIIDDRERSESIIREFERYQIDIKRRRLIIGDYIVEPTTVTDSQQVLACCLFERKTLPDFIASLLDGRLFRQMRQLQKQREQYNVNVALVLEGYVNEKSLEKISRSRINSAAILGAMTKITIAFGVPILRTLGPEDSVKVMMFMARQAGCTIHKFAPNNSAIKQNINSLDYSRYPKKKPNDNKKYLQTQMLQVLPGIGPEKANSLLEQFDSLSKIASASEHEIAAIRGIGLSTARRIKWLIQEPSLEYVSGKTNVVLKKQRQ